MSKSRPATLGEVVDQMDDQTVVQTTFSTVTITEIRIVAPRHVEGLDLADRVRSALGPMVKALDLPRIHVMAEGDRILLHGDVATEDDAERIEAALSGVADVGEIESHLHVGLIPGDTRPSGAHADNSEMYAALLRVAKKARLGATPARVAITGALLSVLEMIPSGERTHVAAHFPADVRQLVTARRGGQSRVDARTPVQLEVTAALRGGISLEKAHIIVPGVISVIRTFIPEEDQDVQATLAHHLRTYWLEQYRRPKTHS